ncbi:lytic polysaccharide monooxygenase [Pseudomonas sp. PDM27]|uniref:lytic polysaccharide monooxygenase n=1 Tax=Pseudomonas sp. PDM27 TaxID=2854769 RepID=UPI001C43BEC5|nr:lytic polysaccharide monooxygenase [Pseudomonas sp. PDM27]MBV7566993.1 lytic polysaccharide monooxygenase [Pseudomonas sp. PDM27]
MKNLQKKIRHLLGWAMAAAFLVPTLIWAHGAVDTPVSRQVHCYTLPNFWEGTNDPACKAVHEVSGTYPGQQWNEVAKLIKDYKDQSTVEKSIPDGELCSAADENKNGLNLPLATWDKTTITPENGKMVVRIIGTAPHVPSFVKIYLSKPGYNAATTKLKWSDLDLIHEARMTDPAPTDWGSQPPKIPGASGYFKFNVTLPPGRSGDAVLFTRWQREDPAGEGFYNCSDITIAGGGTPDPLHDLGPFIGSEMDRLKPGDSVHFRIMDDTPAAKEIVDITHPIDQSNLNQNVWGRQVAEKVGSNIAKIGEKNGSNVVFNTTNAAANSVYATKEAYTKAMSIISGGGETPPDPRPPVARITGPTSLVSEQTYTFSGQSSVGYNGKLDFNWTPAGETGTINADTVTFKAFKSKEPAEHTVLLTVVDRQNKTSNQAELKVIINPADSGSYPPYVKNKTPPYAPNEKVSNKGANYQCKGSTASGWCSQSPPHYEPGVGSDWTDAWDKID